ncbi:hypothetical protein HNR76_002360 [Pseudoxanthomonas broegbernensis]|uniref:PKD domain-containing protein n=1 Tax=Pseudoxanthomonas broegbernensis TaxID=83619 RepID=UPI00160B3F4C|nr:PKD domain-containing protein [Pseudoxanthomonas broegbernensis]MBB6065788.1 hypothetical protein [Pseudoxanthomonas broegbernensis]
MTTDWKQILKRIAIATGKVLWLVARWLFALLVKVGRFIVLRAIPAIGAWLRSTAFPALGRLYRWLPHRRRVVGVAAGAAAIAVAVLLLRVPDDPGAPAPHTAQAPAKPAEPAVLTLTPMRAPPGAAIVANGLALAEGEPFEVTVGGLPAAAQRLDDGRLQLRVPLYLGDGAWPVPPAEAQAVEVRRDGTLLAASQAGLRVTELPRAPGTTARVQRSLDAATTAYERIFESLPASDEQDRVQRRALLAALRGLVSEGDHSLAALLAGTSPLLEGAEPDAELMDALLASGGVADNLDAFAQALGPGPADSGSVALLAAGGSAFPMALSLGSMPTPFSTAGGPKCRGDGKDFELACQMQMYGLLDDLAREYIKPTADTYANVMLALATVGAPLSAHPLSTLISAVLSVANLVIGKIAPSLLPSNLTRFELESVKPLVALQETVPARIVVEARNTPQSITLNDLIDVAKSTVGAAIEFDGYVVETLKRMFYYTIDLYMGVLRGVDHVSPNASDAVNPGLFTLPMKKWGPLKVSSSDLVSLFSYDEPILATREEEMEWRAEQRGQTTVRAMPRGPGERSKVLQDHTLCWGCVWSGGAFGTEMPQSSKRVAVEIEFKALPPQGKAPLDVDLAWELKPREDRAPVPCTVDFGDGTQARRIPDCTDTARVRHTYDYTSRLNEKTGGAYLPTLRIDGSPIEAKAEVFTDWTFRSSPETGQAPLEAKFHWDIPWPPDQKAPRCEFDPGDGSARESFDDCLAVTRTEHTFERRGSFVPTLTLIHGGARDTKTAPVSVAEEGTCDADLLKHKAWTGSVSFSQSRDVWHPRGYYHVVYSHSIRLHARMDERTRREFRGADYLVQYYSPLPEGSAKITYSRHDYSGDRLNSSDTFDGSGRLQRQEPHMSEDGSMLTLTLNAKKCTFSLYLQGQVFGSGEQWDYKGTEAYSGYRWFNSVHVEGMVTSSGSISGSSSVPLLSRSQIERNDIEKTSWASELDGVVGALGENGLGSMAVSWQFAPAD